MSWFGNLLGFDPVKTRSVDTSNQTNLGNQFFDQNSSLNRGMYNNLKQMGVDAAAQQYLSGMRMQSMGQNPFAQQQFKGQLSSNLGTTQNAWQQGMQNNYGIGSGLLGQAMQGNLANAEAYNMAQMQGNKNKTDFFGGLFGSVIGALPNLLFPGGGGN